jgi:hypothetical protein
MPMSVRLGSGAGTRAAVGGRDAGAGPNVAGAMNTTVEASTVDVHVDAEAAGVLLRSNGAALAVGDAS